MNRYFLEPIVKRQREISLTHASLRFVCFLLMILGVFLIPVDSQAFRRGDEVVIQNTFTGLNVRPNPGVSQNNAPIRKLPDGTRGTILEGPRQPDRYTWYKVRWNNVNVEGWSAETVDGCKTLGTGEVADKRDAIVSVLFNLPLSEVDRKTNHDYNGYGCGPNTNNACDGYRGGHSGLDVQTKSVAGNLTANEDFHSLTSGTVIRVGGAFGTIAVYNANDDKTVFYLHARRIYVAENDPVEIGDRLGIQGDTSTGNIGEHVHIEVRDGKQRNSACGATTSEPLIDYLYEWGTTQPTETNDDTDGRVSQGDERTVEPVIVSISPASIESPSVGKQLTVNISIEDGEDIVGYQATLEFDTSALRYVSDVNGDYLPSNVFKVPSILKGDSVTIGASALSGSSDGDGTLAAITFEVLAVKASDLILSKVLVSDASFNTLQVTIENGKVIEPTRIPEDVNGDGEVNIVDLTRVAALFGQTVQNKAEDVNGDGEVNIVDLVLVAHAFTVAAGAPSAHAQAMSTLTANDVRQWLIQAQQLNLGDSDLREGVVVLKQLLSKLTPNKTALLANYPNPFNPETWIPYHLAKDADVTLRIYDVKGQMVRMLVLGHQAAGIYQNRSRAAYWDGRNAVGEPVASGVYFYTLTAGEFTATRKMLIRK